MNFYPIKNAFLQISNLLRPLSQLCPNKKHSLAHSQPLLVTVNLYSCCWAVLGWVEPYILSSNSVKYWTFYMYKIFHNRSIPESMLLSFVTVLPVCRQKIYSAEIFQDKNVWWNNHDIRSSVLLPPPFHDLLDNRTVLLCCEVACVCSEFCYWNTEEQSQGECGVTSCYIIIILQPWVQMYSTEPVLSEENILNERLMLSRSDFPIKPADLVQRCKVWYNTLFFKEYQASESVRS